jgi:hypothetical protein
MKKYTKEMQCNGPCQVPTIWEKAWDYTKDADYPVAIWKCRCCGGETKRIIKNNKSAKLLVNSITHSAI